MNHNHTPLNSLGRAAIRRMILSLVITFSFVIVEGIAGVLSNSLALLTDAAHNLTDVMALALSSWALWITGKAAHARKTYGYHRVGILVALVNSTSLVLIALGILYEAYRRILDPPQVQADLMIIVAALAVCVNLITALLIRKGAQEDLNLRSAFLHLIGDVLSTGGAVLAGIIIRFTAADWVDPLASVLIALLILWNAWHIVRQSISILMESTPADINMDALLGEVLSVAGVRGVHDLHVWSINQSLRSLSAHLLTDDVTLGEGALIQAAVSRMLNEKFGIAHTTLQLECKNCERADLYCELDSGQESAV